MEEMIKILKTCSKTICNRFTDCDTCIATRFQEAGYRKIPEDSVVLTMTEHAKLVAQVRDEFEYEYKDKVVLSREEYEKLQYQWITDSDAYKKGGKEMAEKILNEFANIKINGSSIEDYIVAVKVVDKIDELAKQQGIEIKE